MESSDILIGKILNTPPFQLPPVVHSQGCYTLDIQYLGQKHHKVGLSLEDVLTSYWHFVTKANYQQKRHEDTLRDIPIPAGTTIYRNGS